MTEHSILSPSRFNHLVACPGSWALEKLFPNEENEYSKEGKEAHEDAARSLNGVIFDENAFHLIENKSVEIYVNHVNSIVFNDRDNLRVEKRINISDLHSDCFGTPDAWYYDQQEKELHVWDFKYGFKPVEVFKNWQLISYAIGIVDYLYDQYDYIGSDHYKFYFDGTINFHIVQPRAIHKDGVIRSWSIYTQDLEIYKERLTSYIDDAISENPTFNVGSHCSNCKARSICKKFEEKCDEIVKTTISSKN